MHFYCKVLLFWDLNLLHVAYEFHPQKRLILGCVLAAVWDEQLKASGIITEFFKDRSDVCLASVCDSTNQFNSVRDTIGFFSPFRYWHHWSVSFEEQIQVYSKQLTIRVYFWHLGLVLSAESIPMRSSLFSNHYVWALVRNEGQSRKLEENIRQVRHVIMGQSKVRNWHDVSGRFKSASVCFA